MKKLKRTAAKATMLTSCIVGVVAAVGIACLLALIFAICIMNEYFSVETIRYFAFISQFVGVFAGCVLSWNMASDRKMIACFATAAGLVLLEMCGALLFFDGISGTVIVSLVMAGLGAGAAIYLGNRGKRTPVATKRRKRYR